MCVCVCVVVVVCELNVQIIKFPNIGALETQLLDEKYKLCCYRCSNNQIEMIDSICGWSLGTLLTLELFT